jgi:hypothetical protein
MKRLRFTAGVIASAALFAFPLAWQHPRSVSGWLPLSEARANAGEGSCVLDLNYRVKTAHGWAFIAREVVRRDDKMDIRMSVRNVQAPSELIGLAPGSKDHVVLTEPGSTRKYSPLAITGAEEGLRQVKRDESHDAIFSFPIPERGHDLIFACKWIVATMGGAGQVIEIEVPIDYSTLADCGT